MKWQGAEYGYALKLEQGEEIVASLTKFAVERGIRAGFFSGLGAARELELGYFVRSTREYVRRTFTGEFEIGALTGNYSELDGQPFPHCHVLIGDTEFAAYAGHLFRGVVTVTCEVHVVADPGVIRRVRRPDLSFNPLELPNG